MTRSGESIRNELAASSEFFISVQDKENQVLADVEVMDFGFLPCGGTKKDVLRVTNRTNAKVSGQKKVVRTWHVSQRIDLPACLSICLSALDLVWSLWLNVWSFGVLCLSIMQVTAMWTPVLDSSYVVTPSSADISPYKTYDFTVSAELAPASLLHRHWV